MKKLAAAHKELLGLELTEEDMAELAADEAERREQRKNYLYYMLGYNTALLDQSHDEKVLEAARAAIESINANIANIQNGGNGYA